MLHADGLQWCVQGANLTSADGSTYLLMQTNGNLVLVSAALAKKYPGSSVATLWTSPNSQSLPGPYTAVMQEVAHSSLRAAVMQCGPILFCTISK